MSWLGIAQGIFRLHDSDEWCGSGITVDDAMEILHIGAEGRGVLETMATNFEGEMLIADNDLAVAWGRGGLPSPFPNRRGRATIGFDELVIRRLVDITLPGSNVEPQVCVGRNTVDLKVNYDGMEKFIEFEGPSHFIRDQRYNREPRLSVERKRVLSEVLCPDHPEREVVMWPFWVQRCASNVQALFDREVHGLASVWSTRAFPGQFEIPDPAKVIEDLTARFGALRDGIGYMYEGRAHKPEHPILGKIKSGTEKVDILIPRDGYGAREFWLPKGLGLN